MKTKIIATIGPSSDSPEMIEKLILSGADVLRNNFAHCTFDEYSSRVATIKQLNEKYDKNTKIQVDLRGPVIRIGGNVPKEGILTKEGDVLKFVTKPCKEKQDNEIIVDDPYLHADIEIGDPMLIESGMIELEIIETKKNSHKFKAKVKIGGLILPNKAINLPTTKLTTSSITEKDINDLKYVMSVGVDIVALSFVAKKDDIDLLRKLINDNTVEVWAKIERREALINIDEIIASSDAIIVARGDLGVETPFEFLPILQKNIVRKCQQSLKPAIVATQMLKNMTTSAYPTRAEVSDIANAIFDGAHYVWLSDETANGQHPIEAIRVMKKVVDAVDQHLNVNLN
jgi:pyruvate kinase